MANKTFCPIMTIGFEAPEKGKRDNRTCFKDCAWYNLIEEKCNINVIAEHLEAIESLTDNIADYAGGYVEDDIEGFSRETSIYSGSYR